ncbi:DMT family transporter [Pseudoruegeria sp. SK021]|uniref:DMT family transporter n=1 Tax=Pseudoruegeria sp. SK021 TaxID=1933035 RepID=UPI000A23AA3D|nr:DMT family transporter [Pseudoruegeria sp. SK021]OSP56463.1 EamA family transporter [Pseudoruegeria sp. SK021]
MDIKALAMGVAFALMWSSAFTSARIIVADAPAMLSLAVRFAVSGVIAVGVAKALGQSWRLTRPQWRATVIFGLCQNALYLGLFFTAMKTIEASLASIMASSMPLLVAMIGWAVLGQRLPMRAVAGLLAGLAGVLLIMGTRLSSGADLQGVLLCVGGVIALSVATLSVRGATSGGNVLMIVGLQMLIGAVVLAVVGVMTEPLQVQITAPLIWAMIYTTLVPGLLATVVWFLLVNRIGAVRAATFHFLNPVFGVGIAAIILGEQVRVMDAVGVLVVTAGILAVQTARTER